MSGVVPQRDHKEWRTNISRIMWTVLNCAICTMTLLSIGVLEADRRAPVVSAPPASDQTTSVDAEGRCSCSTPAPTIPQQSEEIPQEELDSYLSLHVSPDLPFRTHDDREFLVVMGVLSMDTADCFNRRKHHRSSWMQYRDVWSSSRTDGQVLVKFVIAKHPSHNYNFSASLQREAKQQTDGDIVGLTVLQGKSSETKKDSSSYGIWGLEAHVKGICVKSFVWRRIAVAAFRSYFVAKADDDVFVVIPQYLATLAVLPRRRSYWGLASQCRRNPFNISTRYPYVYGMLATTSTDVAKGIASAPHLTKLLEPFSGRAADYMLEQLDREDLMIGGAIARTGWSVSIFNDCRFVEPSYYTLGRDVDLVNYDKYLYPYAIMFHKLPIGRYGGMFKKYGEGPGVAYKADTFKEEPYDVPRYRWFTVNEETCKSMMLENCLTFTGWKELGPLDWKLPKVAEKSNFFLASKNAYQNLTSMTSVVIMIGVLSRDSPQESIRRHRIRDACYGAHLLWSPQAPNNPVVMRFVVGKHHYHQHRLSPEINAESAAHGDVVALVRLEGGLREPKRDVIKILQWLNTALKLSPCPFVGVMQSGPTFSFALLVQVLMSLPRQNVFLGNGAATSHKGMSFPFVRDGLAVVSRDVANMVGKDQLASITTFRFRSIAYAFPMLGYAIRIATVAASQPQVTFYHDCRFTESDPMRNSTNDGLCVKGDAAVGSLGNSSTARNGSTDGFRELQTVLSDGRVQVVHSAEGTQQDCVPFASASDQELQH